MKILDCTLRDGGYNVGWDWSPMQINKLINSVRNVSDIIELGYKRPKKSSAICDVCENDVIAGVLGSENSLDNFGYMIDLKEFMDGDNFNSKGFFECQEGAHKPFRYCRIAITFPQLKYVPKVIDCVREAGQLPILSIMQSSLLTSDQIRTVFSYLNTTESKPEILYFANSFGGIQNVEKYLNVIQSANNDRYSIGLHFHDQRSLAFYHAINSVLRFGGKVYIDSSICGIGRGAGNVRTEELITEYYPERVTVEMLDAVKHFKQYASKWCPIYHYCGKNNIHPNYARECKYLGLKFPDAYKILKEIKIEDRNKYNPNMIGEIIK